MPTIKTIFKNTGFLAFGNIVQKIFSILLIIFLARALGDAGFGIYSFAFTFTALFGFIIDVGFSTLFVREISKNKNIAKKYLANALGIKAVLSIFTFGLITLTAPLVDSSQNVLLLVYIAALALIFDSFGMLFKTVFRAFEKMKYEFYSVTIVRFSTLILSVAAVLSGFDIIGAVTAVALANIIGSAYEAIIVYRKFAAPSIEFDFGFWKKIIAKALPFCLMGIFISIYLSTDSVMIAMFRSFEEVGWYNAAYKLIAGLIAFPAIFVTALFPAMSRLSSSKSSAKTIYERSFKYLSLIALPMAIGTTLTAPSIINLVYGPQYANAALALQILVWSAALIFLNQLISTSLNSLNLEKLNTVIVASSIAMNIGLNYFLIQSHGFVGAAVATLATQSAVMLCGMIFLKKRIGSFPLFSATLKILPASIAMALFVFFFQKIISLFILIPAAAIIYFSLVLLSGWFDKQDREMLKKGLNRE
jgi:O-antigen/teichoic acid export membrane protein